MSILFGEHSLSKVAGVFDEAEEARAVADEIMREGALGAEQVRLVGPEDPAVERKLEPEQAGIARTLIRSHIALGIVGLIVGLVVAAALLLSGVEFARASPYYTVIITAGFGAVVGMMFGGLVSLRPDHDVLITEVEEAARQGHWAVVVHPANHEQEMRARNVIGHSHGHLVQTF
ncbi:MAG: hypothetical protein WCA45_15005 [Thiobacillaceae bacterium]